MSLHLRVKYNTTEKQTDITGFTEMLPVTRNLASRLSCWYGIIYRAVGSESWCAILCRIP